MIYAGTVLWLLAGVIGGCADYAFMQREWPRLANRDRPQDTARSLFYMLTGPVTLITQILVGGFRHGLLFPGRKP